MNNWHAETIIIKRIIMGCKPIGIGFTFATLIEVTLVDNGLHSLLHYH